MARYSVYILPRALAQIDRLPGSIRSRVRRAVAELREEPCPGHSKQLAYELGPGRELRRLRLDDWRVVYLIDQAWSQIYVLAARRRPPYAYNDLERLVREIDN